MQLGVRPEHAMLHGGDIALGQMEIVLVEHLGGNTLLYGRLPDGQTLTVQVEDQARLMMGDTVPIFANAARCHLFAEDGRAFAPV